MAIFTPGPLVGQVSGKIGGIVASRNRGGAYWRNNAVPSVATSARALEVKSILGGVSQLWANVSAADRLAWVSYARQNPFINRLGRAISGTANNHFVGVNSILLGVGAEPITLPPAFPAPFAAPIDDFTVTVTGPDLQPTAATLVMDTDALEDYQVYEVFACRVASPTINYVRNLFTRVFVSAPEAAPTIDLTAALQDALGSYQVGTVYHVQVRIVDTRTGLVSSRVSARVTAVASPPV